VALALVVAIVSHYKRVPLPVCATALLVLTLNSLSFFLSFPALSVTFLPSLWCATALLVVALNSQHSTLEYFADSAFPLDEA
jgi:hypothetical protein